MNGFELGIPLVAIGVALFTLGYAGEHGMARRSGP